MDSKKLIWFGMVVGSAIGGYIPALWGAGFFSMSGVVTTAIGGILGIYIGLKLSQ